MAAAFIISGRQAAAFGVANQTQFIPMSGGFVSNSATESQSQHKIGIGGTLSNLTVNINTNNRTSNTTIKVRNNSADAGTPSVMSVTYGSGITGILSDTTNTAAVAVGDLLNNAIVLGTGTQQLQLTLVSVTFTKTSGTGFIFAYFDPGGGTAMTGTGPITNFMAFSGGNAGQFATTEANAQIQIPSAGTLSYMTMNVSTNGRSTSTVVTARKNTANGNQTFTYTSGQTGIKTDTTNTDSIAAGDLVCVSPVLGTGTGTFTVRLSGVTFTATTDGESALITALAGGILMTNVANNCNPVGGNMSGFAEAGSRGQLGSAAIASKMWLSVSANTSSAAINVFFRVAGANGNQNVTIGGNATGTFQDTTHNDSVGATQFIDYQFGISSGGPTVNSTTSKLRSAATLSDSVSESGTASDNPSALVDFTVSDSESGTASDDPSASLAIAASQSESATASDAPSSLATLAASENETATASETPASAATLGASDSESAAASDDGSSSGTLGGSGDESATAVETASAALSIVTSVSEAASAVETESMTLSLALSVDETASALDDPSAGGHSVSDSVSESAGADDTSSTTATISASESESASASDHPASQVNFAVSDAESVSAADASSMVLQITVTTSESVGAADTVSSAALLGANDDEAGAAVDFVSAVVEFEAFVEEIGNAQDVEDVNRILPIDSRYIIPSEPRLTIPSAARVRSIPSEIRGRVIPSERLRTINPPPPTRSFG